MVKAVHGEVGRASVLFLRAMCINVKNMVNFEFPLFMLKCKTAQAVERIGRSAFKDGEIPEELLVLSCEEDYAICAPFLEKG